MKVFLLVCESDLPLEINFAQSVLVWLWFLQNVSVSTEHQLNSGQANKKDVGQSGCKEDKWRFIILQLPPIVHLIFLDF